MHRGLAGVAALVGASSLMLVSGGFAGQESVRGDSAQTLEVASSNEALRPELVKLGEKTARRKGCASCHSLDGKIKPGPTWKGLYGSTRVLTNGKEMVANEEYLRRAIFDPRAEVVKGFPRSLMPKDFGRKLSDEQTAAIIELIKSLR